MARTKATFVAAPGHRMGNKNIINGRNSMFKIKTLLLQAFQLEDKKEMAKL